LYICYTEGLNFNWILKDFVTIQKNSLIGYVYQGKHNPGLVDCFRDKEIALISRLNSFFFLLSIINVFYLLYAACHLTCLFLCVVNISENGGISYYH